MNASAKTLDLIAIGRSSVDLYGQQVGGRLEDMASFSKAVGGCPSNIAIGTARLGLKSGLITRVGDEHMGRFIREQLVREGVDVGGVVTDPKRLTALVVLGIRDDKTFPLIFYRSDCADAALDEGDIDEAYIASARAIVVSGTHFSMPNTAAAQRKAMRLARKHGGKVVFDVDYRPNLWGLAGHGAGEERYIRSGDVTAHLKAILPECDLIVGTEEELMIAGGVEEPLDAVREVRKLSKATIVMKRGPMGCVVFDGDIPDDVEKGVKGPGFPVEVYNVLGAGDAFISGFLRGWLRNEPVATCCAYANACGAFAVSRLLCSVEYPTFAELSHFLGQTSHRRQLRFDESLAHIHHATTRRRTPDTLTIFSIDHRPDHLGLDAKDEPAMEALARFKSLAVKAAQGAGVDGAGMFLEGLHGREALFRALDKNLWVARQLPGDPMCPPLDDMVEWPVAQTVKIMLNLRGGRPSLDAQLPTLAAVARTARNQGRELLVEALPLEGERDGAARMLESVYRAGVKPDWWLVEPQEDEAAWQALGDVIRRNDSLARGFIVIARSLDSARDWRVARAEPLVRGVVGGRVLFGETLKLWMTKAIDDQAALAEMITRYRELAKGWSAAQAAEG